MTHCLHSMHVCVVLIIDIIERSISAPFANTTLIGNDFQWKRKNGKSIKQRHWKHTSSVYARQVGGCSGVCECECVYVGVPATHQSKLTPRRLKHLAKPKYLKIMFETLWKIVHITRLIACTVRKQRVQIKESLSRLSSYTYKLNNFNFGRVFKALWNAFKNK